MLNVASEQYNRHCRADDALLFAIVCVLCKKILHTFSEEIEKENTKRFFLVISHKQRSSRMFIVHGSFCASVLPTLSVESPSLIFPIQKISRSSHSKSLNALKNEASAGCTCTVLLLLCWFASQIALKLLGVFVLTLVLRSIAKQFLRRHAREDLFDSSNTIIIQTTKQAK